MPEAPKSRHEIEQEHVIAQVRQSIRDTLDQYIGSKIEPMNNENIRLSVMSVMEVQMRSIAPNSEYRIDVSPDANNPSLMNVDIMIRNPYTINYHTISSRATETQVEIEGQVWTKFSLQA